MKVALITAFVIVAAIILTVVGYYTVKSIVSPNPHVGDHTKLERTFTTEEEQIIRTNRFTIEDLAKHNGTDGTEAYVAIDNVVYDLSGAPSWAKGMHHGVSAGTDATEAFVQSVHDKQILQKLRVVGGLDP
ncbi:cytochrome b5 domain-containing protein [Corynebacterium sp.]|uniref:cytochrome b5 domain-containing protein n=1 Tax=Corynebacterium sp. TaxID=1720 RepID=UPI0026DB8C17|nr:cytochrome b5 domain-containing protein [Corynebacterium sp.]MDO5077500.1 cytochrome b5 domain-containing protein [Corynebacterium sp.]